MNYAHLESDVCDRYGFEYLGTGRSRAAYRRGRWVYKVPLNERGDFDNYREAQIYAKTHGRGAFKLAEQLRSSDNGEYARCRVLKNGWLVMEYAEPVPSKLAPKWADFIDCQQVGTNHRGVVVAYDYA